MTCRSSLGYGPFRDSLLIDFDLHPFRFAALNFCIFFAAISLVVDTTGYSPWGASADAGMMPRYVWAIVMSAGACITAHWRRADAPSRDS